MEETREFNPENQVAREVNILAPKGSEVMKRIRAMSLAAQSMRERSSFRRSK